jgi:hypothetical protein
MRVPLSRVPEVLSLIEQREQIAAVYEALLEKDTARIGVLTYIERYGCPDRVRDDMLTYAKAKVDDLDRQLMSAGVDPQH